MADEPPEEKTLRKVLSDVINGYTFVDNEGEEAYVKHFGSREQQELEEHYDRIFKKAQKNGLPTEKESMEFLKEQDLWTEQDEVEYVDVQKYIENLEETKKNLIIPSQIKEIEKDIEESQTKLAEKQSKRDSLLTETCETYARNKSNDYSIFISFYKNKSLTEKLFTEQEFDELSKTEMSEWFGFYMKESVHLSIENIKYLAISNIFTMYYNILGSKNLYKIIPKTPFDFSFYQLNLLNYAKILNSIIENHPKMPDKVKKDPDRLLAYAEAKSKNQAIVDKGKNKQGFSVMGASKQDMGEMGVSDELSISPFELAKKKGSLTMEDFQNFS
jgi:hypothetical protein|tara:strand:- start:10393 stop:11382 length:990 start_codon:yes stop_codon:yes gene_type:complete